jgi:hypothetical protein
MGLSVTASIRPNRRVRTTLSFWDWWYWAFDKEQWAGVRTLGLSGFDEIFQKLRSLPNIWRQKKQQNWNNGPPCVLQTDASKTGVVNKIDVSKPKMPCWSFQIPAFAKHTHILKICPRMLTKIDQLKGFFLVISWWLQTQVLNLTSKSAVVKVVDCYSKGAGFDDGIVFSLM